MVWRLLFICLAFFGGAPIVAPGLAPAALEGGGDPELPENGYERWMLPGGTGNGPAVMGQIRAGSTVVHLIDGPSTFKAMVAAMETARTNQHYIYLLGWWLTHDFRMRGLKGTTMADYLKAASDRGVEVRSMLSAHLTNETGPAVAWINNNLDNGSAIHDNRHLNFGSHHQKILIVDGQDGLIAFVGGVDVNPDRLFMQGVGPNERGDTSGAPFHDVHAEVRGRSAWDLLQIFVERWSDHPGVAALPAAKRGLRGATTGMPGAIAGSTLRTQVGRTYGNSTGQNGVNPVYAFAPMGSQQCARMIMKGIASAQKFIYIEDQYFVDTTSIATPIAAFNVRAALRAALARGVKVIVVIPHDSITAMGGQTAYRRALLINNLRAAPGAGGGGFRVFYPRRWGEYKTYVHSKTWVFDDEFAIIGSANTNRRSFTHDSESAIGVWDRGKADKGALYFAHSLRIALWSKYLNTNDMKLLKDGMAAQALWNANNLPKGARVVESTYPATPKAPLFADAQWNNIDPEGS
ncbi:MAG TPA: phosphatidylserine/phosphatidylglycerophosphate/cardiolipin synthase family protein [Fimbriimonadaceae bacterium]|nr:phosphatidylserine/phosphatidylglycerophosphate/cardiolipin synthase family protein [Fimbriimonadaceae bacterium]HRJ97545.1 phosphatidylserine/phosphatidylglycerophosphate/cardiolipin synthase family protein [Fimbriimonadaceae bacterium]